MALPRREERETAHQRRALERQERREGRREEPRSAAFSRARHAELSYGAQLRAYARQIARIIEAFLPETSDWLEPHQMAQVAEALDDYADASEPWARAVAGRMVAETNRRDLTAWDKYTRGMSRELRAEIAGAPIGDYVRELLAGQVDLITSLPREAAQWVHEQSLEAVEAGARYQEKTALELGWDPDTGTWKRALPPRSELAEKLARATPGATEQWLRNRATLIARTETARAQSVLVQARSKHIGAELYEWQTAGDWKVRPSHRALQLARTKYGIGIYAWDDPPLSDAPDYHSHPGQIFNCRCTALPIIPDV